MACGTCIAQCSLNLSPKTRDVSILLMGGRLHLQHPCNTRLMQKTPPQLVMGGTNRFRALASRTTKFLGIPLRSNTSRLILQAFVDATDECIFWSSLPIATPSFSTDAIRTRPCLRYAGRLYHIDLVGNATASTRCQGPMEIIRTVLLLPDVNEILFTTPT